jgi:tight adherence protein C
MGPALIVISAVLFGAAVAWFALVLVSITARPHVADLEPWHFNVNRKARLRAGSRVYRWFEPLVLELQGNWLLRVIGRPTRVQRDLDRGAAPLPWIADEFIATAAVRAVATASCITLVAAWLAGPSFALLCGGVTLVGTFFYCPFRLQAAASRRLVDLKKRLPFAIDVLALMLEAGAGFREALLAIVRDNAEHPLGQEFGKVLHEIEHGQPLHQALDGLRNRFHDDDVNEIVFAVQKAEELGTPLSQVLLQMSDQLRLKRSQWIERDAGKAKANITFPGFVVMLACLLVIMAPFVLNALMNYSTTF